MLGGVRSSWPHRGRGHRGRDHGVPDRQRSDRPQHKPATGLPPAPSGSRRCTPWLSFGLYSPDCDSWTATARATPARGATPTSSGPAAHGRLAGAACSRSSQQETIVRWYHHYRRPCWPTSRTCTLTTSACRTRRLRPECVCSCTGDLTPRRQPAFARTDLTTTVSPTSTQARCALPRP